MEHLERKGIISAEEQKAIFERALELLETDPADDGGITALAQNLIEQQLPQGEIPQRVNASF